ncbi:MAG: LON peptidase substrate-binding domain-containing protein [Acetobacteraceae bacterium]
MAHFAPRSEDLPGEIGVFPLEGALLLPGGRLPLNIFEPRYLALTESALATGRLFGMIQPDPHAPAGPAGPGLYRVGCLGRIISFSETEDGRYLLTLAGVTRFAVGEELAGTRGFRRVRARYEEFADDLAPAAAPAFDREALLEALRLYFRTRAIETNWEAIRQIPDAQLITTLAMGCPFEPSEQQALLEAPAATDRATALAALLRMGGHRRGEGSGSNPS